MDPSSRMSHLGALAEVLSSGHRAEPLLAASLPLVLAAAGADSAMVLARGPGGVRVVARSGLDLDAEVAPSPPPAGDPTLDRAVPPTWQAHHVRAVAAHRLPEDAGELVLAWTRPDPEPVGLGLALLTLDNGVGRAQAEERLADLVARVDNAQHLADMGDYDWHIPTDVNTWSDQLFRIYGHEPQSFHPSYDTFLSLIHPDDRDRIAALHQHAYATGEPYRMIERIVRPDGEVRYLSSNGEVIMDAGGTPVRMRGTCIDITDHVRADRERERSAARFQGLVDAAPDAILVLGQDQRVLEANHRADDLLGGDARGLAVGDILPGWPHGTELAVRACGLGGDDLLLDVSTVVVDAVDDAPEDDRRVAVFLRDSRVRREREALAARVAEAGLRRRQALEINDNVVQGLVAAIYALDLGEADTSSAFVGRTLGAARAMMDDLPS